MNINTETKVCSKCSKEKSVKEFYKDKLTKDGLRHHCKMCLSKRARKYNERNKEKRKVRGAKYRREHKKEIAEQYQKCKKQRKIYSAEYRRRNKEKLRKKKKSYQQENKDKIAKHAAKYLQSPALHETYAKQLGWVEKISKGSSGELLVACAYCGKRYSPTVSSVKNRIKALFGKSHRKGSEARLYCCEECKQACPMYKQRIHWKDRMPATSREVDVFFRQAVLERDNWECQRCGVGVEEQLHAHHIEGAVQQPGMANDLENGITLCIGCHKLIHSQGGCRSIDLRCPNNEGGIK